MRRTEVMKDDKKPSNEVSYIITKNELEDEVQDNGSSSNQQFSPCEMCGGKVVYDPTLECMRCDFCGNVSKTKTTTHHINGQSIAELANITHDWEVDRKIIICQNCGGKTTMGINEMLAYCIFCGSGHIINQSETDLGMRPKSVIPFRLTSDEAIRKFHQWGNSKRGIQIGGIPKSFFKKPKTVIFRGVYMPYWSYQMDARVTWHKDVITYTSNNSLNDNNTVHHSGSYTKEYIDLLVPGIKSKYLTYLDMIQTYDFSELRDYQPSYLSGFFAEKYVVKPEKAYLEVLEIIEKEITREQNLEDLDTQDAWHFIDYSDIRFSLYLVPTYIGSFYYKKKLYFVAINGQTGEIAGGDFSKRRKRNNILYRTSEDSFFKIIRLALQGLPIIIIIMVKYIGYKNMDLIYFLGLIWVLLFITMLISKGLKGKKNG